MSKPATAGKENLKTVILQSHMDMVCEKNKDTQHNFDTDPIETYIDGEWLKAKGTTLVLTMELVWRLSLQSWRQTISSMDRYSVCLLLMKKPD